MIFLNECDANERLNLWLSYSQKTPAVGIVSEPVTNTLDGTMQCSYLP